MARICWSLFLIPRKSRNQALQSSDFQVCFRSPAGIKLHGFREQRKMTQAQLGLVLNPPATRASIANIENGKQRVLVHTLGLRLIPAQAEALVLAWKVNDATCEPEPDFSERKIGEFDFLRINDVVVAVATCECCRTVVAHL